MRRTLAEIDNLIDRIHEDQRKLDPINPEFLYLDLDLQCLYEEREALLEDLYRLQQEDLYHQKDLRNKGLID